jgi:hypothetical protein
MEYPTPPYEREWTDDEREEFYAIQARQEAMSAPVDRADLKRRIRALSPEKQRLVLSELIGFANGKE